MDFTFIDYKFLIDQLRDNGYIIADYSDWSNFTKTVILRHDVDFSLDRAVKMAELENIENVKSTYFILLTSDFYNIFSANSTNKIRKIISYGHCVGLHFDETAYEELDDCALRNKIINECRLLETITSTPITVVSMHRPGKRFIGSDFHISDEIQNSYGKVYFEEFKYVSDSRRRWGAPIEKIVSSNEYNRLHILTHPFWYDNENNIHDALYSFINIANIERWDALKNNFTNLDSVIREDEIGDLT